jgi:hypothetical protein
MMKTNVMTVDASLLLVMKKSTFALLTNCFAFARLSSDKAKFGFFLIT